LIWIVARLTLAAQETVRVEGLIKGRSGDLIVLQTKENPDLVVELKDGADVGQLQGMLKARNKKMSMAA
jgi:OOP family OmpA-OmpF porin